MEQLGEGNGTIQIILEHRAGDRAIKMEVLRKCAPHAEQKGDAENGNELHAVYSLGNGNDGGIFSDRGISPRIIRVAAPVSFK